MTEVGTLATKAHSMASGVFSFGWMVLFLISGRSIGGVLPLWSVLVGALVAVVLAFLGLHPGERYFLIGSPERWVRGCRSVGIVMLRSWVIHGDRMNAALRARFAPYRVIRRGAVEEYILRTRDMERVHLACLLASAVAFALALLGSRWELAWVLLAATLATNGLPIVLQRFNRARCQLVLQKRRATWPNQSPEPTALSVTPRADARVAPASTVAHL